MRLCFIHINIYIVMKNRPGSFIFSVAWFPRNCPHFSQEGTPGLRATNILRVRLLPGGRGRRQEVPTAASPEAPPRPVNAGQTRSAALAQSAPRSQVSFLLREVNVPGREPHTPRPEPRLGRNRKRRPPVPAPPAAAGVRGGGGPGKGGGPRGADGLAGGRRSGTPPRPLYNSFPALPPSQGGGWRRDGPSRTPAGRRRHLLPHWFPGLLGERAARPSPASPHWEPGPRALPSGASRSPDGLPGS